MKTTLEASRVKIETIGNRLKAKTALKRSHKQHGKLEKVSERIKMQEGSLRKFNMYVTGISEKQKKNILKFWWCWDFKDKSVRKKSQVTWKKENGLTSVCF